MTIENRGTRNQYTATGGQTVFAYNFEIFDEADLAVYKNSTLLAIGSDYTVNGVGSDTGGAVTLVVGATAGDIMTLFRDADAERLTDYQNSGDFLAQEVNDDFDRIWAIIQQIQTDQDRSLKLTQLTTAPIPLSVDEPVASNLLRWKSDTSGIESIPVSSITPTGEVTTDYNRNVSDYAALRAIDTDEFVDGQAITVTNTGIAGDFVIRNSVAHGLTDNGGTLIVIDADWYAERVFDGPVSVKWFGAVGDVITDDTNAVQAAIDYVKANDKNLAVNGDFAVTAVSLDDASGLRLTGRGSFVGISSTQTDCLVSINNTLNIAVDGNLYVNVNYNTNYECAIWIRTDGVGQAAAYLDFSNISPQNSKLAWKFGNADRPQDLVSEINITGGQTFGCPSVVEAYGAQTVVNFTGCTLASLTGNGDAAWQALPQRTVVSHGATVNITGGELLHVLLSTGGSGSDFNSLLFSEAFDAGAVNQYGKILVNAAVVESAARFGSSGNAAGLPSPESGYIGFVGCQGVSTNITQAIVETDSDYAGVVRLEKNNFFASSPRLVNHIVVNNADCDIYLDQGSLFKNFKNYISGVSGGTLHFDHQMVFNCNNLGGQSFPNGVATTANFTSIVNEGELERWSSAYSGGTITVPDGGWSSVIIESQILLSGLIGEWYIQINDTSYGVRTLSNYSHNSYSINNLSAGDTIKVVVLNLSGSAKVASSTFTDWLQVFAKR